jgi:hypothetical protein
MIKAFTIGTVVVCHLLTGKMNQLPDGSSKEIIQKILGQVVDIQQKNSFEEKLDKKEVIEFKRDVLIVKEKNSDITYEINKQACMPVRQETDVERQNRLFPKKEIKTMVTKKVSIDEDGKESVINSASSLSDKAASLIEENFINNKQKTQIEKPKNTEPQIVEFEQPLKKEEADSKPVDQKEIKKDKSESKGLFDYLKE